MTAVAPEITDELEELWSEGPPKCELAPDQEQCPNDAAWIATVTCGGCTNSRKNRAGCTPCKENIDSLMARGYQMVCRYCGYKPCKVEWRPL